MKTTPRPHQAEEYLEHRNDPRRALFWWCRAGKTKPCIDNACWLYKGLDIDGVVVLARTDVGGGWLYEELPSHHWDDVPYRAHWWQSQPGTKAREAEHEASLRRVLQPLNGLGWLIMNPEALLVKRAEIALRDFMKTHPRLMLIVDECHNFGEPGARQTKKVRWIARQESIVRFKRILSATSVHSSPFKAYSQFNILREGFFGMTTVDAFRQLYGEWKYPRTAGGRVYPKLTKYRNLDDMVNRMAEVTSWVTREQANLPPLVDTLRVYQLQPELLKMHDTLRQQPRVLKLGNIEIEGGTGAPFFSKLQQVASGFVYHTAEDGTRQAIDLGFEDLRTKTLIANLEDAGERPAIIWCRFTHEIERVHRALLKAGTSAVKFYGKMSRGERDDAKRAFQGGRVTYFVGQPASAREGMNLPIAENIFWYSHTDRSEWYDQASERASAGTQYSIGRVHLCAHKTVDRLFLSRNQAKIDLAHDIERMGVEAILAELDQ